MTTFLLPYFTVSSIYIVPSSNVLQKYFYFTFAFDYPPWLYFVKYPKITHLHFDLMVTGEIIVDLFTMCLSSSRFSHNYYNKSCHS